MTKREMRYTTDRESTQTNNQSNARAYLPLVVANIIVIVIVVVVVIV